MCSPFKHKTSGAWSSSMSTIDALWLYVRVEETLQGSDNKVNWSPSVYHFVYFYCDTEFIVFCQRKLFSIQTATCLIQKPVFIRILTGSVMGKHVDWINDAISCIWGLFANYISCLDHVVDSWQFSLQLMIVYCYEQRKR